MAAGKTRAKRAPGKADQQLAQLRELVPDAFSEGLLDFEKLRAAINGPSAGSAERYGLDWIGKPECLRLLEAPSHGTLVDCPADSIDWEQTRNLFVEGDNLDVLKLLCATFAGRVKLIYIDPPYNIGNGYVYRDDFANPPAWWSMIYPRLLLAKQLLRRDGAIFVSIDDHEVHNLRLLMDEALGAENFVASLVWAAGRKNDSRLISVSHEYVLCYARSAELLRKNKVQWRERKRGLEEIYAAYARIRRQLAPDYQAMTQTLKQWYAGLAKTHPARQHAHYSWVDEQGIYFADNISWPGGGGPTYEVLHPRTGKPCQVPSRGWMYARPETMQAAVNENRVHFGADETTVPCSKSYLRDREYQVPYSVFYQDGRAATKRLRRLLGGDFFDHPKDEHVLQNIVGFASQDDDIVLDFFAGSATTAHAVLAANRADGGRRQFVMVQSPERVPERSAARTAGFATISQLGQQRIRKVIEILREESGGQVLPPGATNEDLGFRVLKFAANPAPTGSGHAAAKPPVQG